MYRNLLRRRCNSPLFARKSRNFKSCKYSGINRSFYTSVKSLSCSETENNESEAKATYLLPWPYHPEPFANLEPIQNRIAGMFLLSSIARKFGHTFSRREFLYGVSDAVRALADILADKTRHLELEYLLAPVLYTAMKKSLQNLPENSQIQSEVESLRGAVICSISTIFGDAEPGDRHMVSWLGQNVVTSKSKLAALMQGDDKFTFNTAQELGKEASLTRLEFQIGVSFLTTERFLVVDGDRKVQGSKEFRDCYHFWKFSSLVDWDNDVMEYPFDWTIVDINDYVKNTVREL